MKQLIIILLTTITLYQPLSAQVHFVEKGALKVGIKVTLDDRILPMDSLCDGFDPETNIPVNLMIPEKSSLGIVTDSIGELDLALIINSQPPIYTNRPSSRLNSFSMSSSPGSRNSYSFVDEANSDTLTIAWKVGYRAIGLDDIFPAEAFSDYISYQIKNIFESDYPDSSMYNWKSKSYVTELDSRGLPTNLNLPYNENGLFFVITDLTEDARIQMKGIHSEPMANDPEHPFDLLLYEDLKPGDYEFRVWPYEGAPENLMLRYSFTVLKPWWKETPAAVGLTLLIAFLVGAILFSVFRIRQQRKTKELQWSKQLTEAELKAIRAQLNPHFLFNALSSIQNLVSSGKNENASIYINQLSRLLRKVLSSSEKQFHQLDEELEMTRLYLELEKLRFAFKTKITVSEDVDQTSLVPVLLLQPYVENAIKHGIASMGEKGLIELVIKRTGDMLKIDITDNGTGLSAPNEHSSGINIGSERIRNLNELYSGEASVKIENRTDGSGVRVHISLPLE